MANTFIISGSILFVIGILLKTGLKIPLLPGDIFYRSDNVTVYVPIVSSIILSIVLTVLLNLFRK